MSIIHRDLNSHNCLVKLVRGHSTTTTLSDLKEEKKTHTKAALLTGQHGGRRRLWTVPTRGGGQGQAPS